MVWRRRGSWRRIHVALRIAHLLCWPRLCSMLSTWISQETSQYFILSYPGVFKLLIVQTFFKPSCVSMIWSSQEKWSQFSSSNTSMWHSGYRTSCPMNEWLEDTQFGIFTSPYWETSSPVTGRSCGLSCISGMKAELETEGAPSWLQGTGAAAALCAFLGAVS